MGGSKTTVHYTYPGGKAQQEATAEAFKRLQEISKLYEQFFIRGEPKVTTDRRGVTTTEPGELLGIKTPEIPEEYKDIYADFLQRQQDLSGVYSDVLGRLRELSGDVTREKLLSIYAPVIEELNRQYNLQAGIARQRALGGMQQAGLLTSGLTADVLATQERLAQEALSGQIAQLLAQGYEAERQRQLAAISALPTLATTAASLPLAQLEVEKYLRNVPLERLLQLQQGLSAMASTGTASAVAVPQTSTSPLQTIGGILGIMGSGLGLISGLGGLFAPRTPITVAPMAMPGVTGGYLNIPMPMPYAPVSYLGYPRLY